ncbi:hypothetical protein ACFWY5_28085 [Nonomuraea sp. NPDC059007]|uniref:hypothetical protein n=1 Tax=Nonomuraea sp. NPDC059007 TaxID=3346692 RepID=UPI003684A790
MAPDVASLGISCEGDGAFPREDAAEQEIPGLDREDAFSAQLGTGHGFFVEDPSPERPDTDLPVRVILSHINLTAPQPDDLAHSPLVRVVGE